MDKKNAITNQALLYGLILLTALLVRLTFLGRVPLGEGEASWAIQAWQSARGGSLIFGSQVGYLAFSGAFFRLFGGSDFLARLWPALIGVLLVGAPAKFRKELGLLPALVMAAGLALDPALAAASRTAGSSLPALAFLVLALAFFNRGQLSWAAFFLGMGLISGQAFWLGILILGLSVLAASLAGLMSPLKYIKGRIRACQASSQAEMSGLLVALLFLVLIASSFLIEPSGLTAWAGALPEFLSSWGQPSGVSPLKILLSLALGSPFALVFGLVRFGRSWSRDDQQGRILSLAFAAAILALLVYPGRQAADVIWIVLPLWAGAAGEIVRIWKSSRSVWASYLLAGLVAVLSSLNWLTFIGVVFQYGNQRVLLLELGLLAASIALVVLSMVVISSEWDPKIAWKGLAMGAGLTLLLLTISSLSLDAFVWEHDPRSLFAGDGGPGQMELLQDSISNASLTATGRPDSIEGAVVSESPSLAWYLKDYPALEFTGSTDSESPPPVLITSQEGGSLADSQIYRGQDFVLAAYPGWQGLIPGDWISWIGFRHGPLERAYIILWIRNDINSGY